MFAATSDVISLGSEESNPGFQDQNLTCNASYTTPQQIGQLSTG